MLDTAAEKIVASMEEVQFAMLAERHKKVLRLYRARWRLKEIARELSLSENSVNTYLTEAVQILGAPGRRAAADALAKREPPSQDPRYVVSVAAGDTPGAVTEPPRGPDKPAIGVGILPLRSRDGTPNRLALHVRLLWIVALLVMLVGGVAIAIAIYSVYVKPMESALR